MSDILPLCDKVFFLNPELGHFVPNGVFLPYASAEIEGVEFLPPKPNRVPRIVHAPSGLFASQTFQRAERGAETDLLSQRDRHESGYFRRLLRDVSQDPARRPLAYSPGHDPARRIIVDESPDRRIQPQRRAGHRVASALRGDGFQ